MRRFGMLLSRLCDPQLGSHHIHLLPPFPPHFDCIRRARGHIPLDIESIPQLDPLRTHFFPETRLPIDKLADASGEAAFQNVEVARELGAELGFKVEVVTGGLLEGDGWTGL